MTLDGEALQELFKQLPILNHKNVHIKDPDKVQSLVKRLISGGPDKLQVIADFDLTITKQHVNGVPHESSFCIINHCQGLPSDFNARDKAIVTKYVPIERDPTVPEHEKFPLMVEFYNMTSELYTGFCLNEEEITNAIRRTTTALRDGSVHLISKLNNLNIPFIIFSAGLGDVINALLKYYNAVFPNTHVISNFLKFKDGKVNGFCENVVHPLNKNGLAAEHTEFFQLMSSRCNVILMGDNLGDANMANGLSNTDAVLKIGFLYGDVELRLKHYQDYFDIVLVDDQTMDVANEIIDKFC